jgi:hypothetical protein
VNGALADLNGEIAGVNTRITALERADRVT